MGKNFMDQISFDAIAKAWRVLVTDPVKLDGLQTQAPTLVTPTAIKLKKVAQDGQTIHIRFYGFESASTDTNGIPTIKRLIVNWLKEISENVKVIGGNTPDLNVVVDVTSKFTEAAIPVFRRDPKTNTIKKVFKCVGGAKDGRRVADPAECLTVPDVDKRINLAITRKAKVGQVAKSRVKTKLTNIVSKRVRKANQRLKKARGF